MAKRVMWVVLLSFGVSTEGFSLGEGDSSEDDSSVASACSLEVESVDGFFALSKKKRSLQRVVRVPPPAAALPPEASSAPPPSEQSSTDYQVPSHANLSLTDATERSLSEDGRPAPFVDSLVVEDLVAPDGAVAGSNQTFGMNAVPEEESGAHAASPDDDCVGEKVPPAVGENSHRARGGRSMVDMLQVVPVGQAPSEAGSGDALTDATEASSVFSEGTSAPPISVCGTHGGWYRIETLEGVLAALPQHIDLYRRLLKKELSSQACQASIVDLVERAKGMGAEKDCFCWVHLSSINASLSEAGLSTNAVGESLRFRLPGRRCLETAAETMGGIREFQEWYTKAIDYAVSKGFEAGFEAGERAAKSAAVSTFQEGLEEGERRAKARYEEATKNAIELIFKSFDEDVRLSKTAYEESAKHAIEWAFKFF